MKTIIVEVGGLLSTLSARGVEKQLSKLIGVKKAEVNYVAGSATVVYDEKVVDLKTIKARVHKCGYHCAGEQMPKHVCVPEDPPVAAHAHGTHGERKVGEHKPDAMAREMGHGGGMDMKAMVRDMRNRFWVCLIFSIPIFIYSPMGGLFTPPAPPFGLDLNRWLFFLATIAVIWPSWPFFVAAWRALKNGVLNMAVLVVLSGVPAIYSVSVRPSCSRGFNSLKPSRCCWCSSCSVTG